MYFGSSENQYTMFKLLLLNENFGNCKNGNHVKKSNWHRARKGYFFFFNNTIDGLRIVRSLDLVLVVSVVVVLLVVAGVVLASRLAVIYG